MPTTSMVADLPRTPLVLIADPDPDTLDLCAFILETAGFRTATAADGVAALSLARARPPDVVITDLMLPGLSGMQLCRALKGDPVTASVPVLTVTGSWRDGLADEARRAGFAKFILKPCSPSALLGAIAEVLDRECVGCRVAYRQIARPSRGASAGVSG